MSDLHYRCGRCGIDIGGAFSDVIELIKLHNHDWDDIRYVVIEEEQANAAKNIPLPQPDEREISNAWRDDYNEY